MILVHDSFTKIITYNISNILTILLLRRWIWQRSLQKLKKIFTYLDSKMTTPCMWRIAGQTVCQSCTGWRRRTRGRQSPPRWWSSCVWAPMWGESTGSRWRSFSPWRPGWDRSGFYPEDFKRGLLKNIFEKLWIFFVKTGIWLKNIEIFFKNIWISFEKHWNFFQKNQ